MFEAEGNFLRQWKGKGYIARVTVRVNLSSETSSIVTACSGDGWSGQGNIEEVSATGYDNWKAGAIAGIRYALETARCQNCSVIVTRILGIATDTNPTIVGAAAINAVWKAIDYIPSDLEQNQIEVLVLSSWEHSPDKLPDFSESVT